MEVMNVLIAADAAKRTFKMKTFTIENESNDITLHTTIQEAEAVPNAERFRNKAALAKLAANWPAARLVDIWNSLPGATPVKRFKDRGTAVSRIWRALQSFGDTALAEGPDQPKLAPVPEADQMDPAARFTTEATPVSPETSEVTSQQPPAKIKATRAGKAPKAARNAGLPREGSKTSRVIAMLKQDGGATLEKISETMGWELHTTRSLMSAGGPLAKKHGLLITSENIGDQRTYSIKA